VYGLFNPVNPADKIESTTSYSESSTVVPVYTHAKEGSDDFKKVIADLGFYNTKPEKIEVTRFIKTSINRGYEETYSLIDGKDAESLYYHTNDYTLILLRRHSNTYLECQMKIWKKTKVLSSSTTRLKKPTLPSLSRV
jgi:hypothetical protein